MLHGLIISLLMIFVFPIQQVNEKIDNYLKEKLSGYDKYEFEVIKSLNEEFEFVNEENLTLKGGLNYLPVKIKKQNSGNSLTYITIRLRLYKTVLVLLNNIKQKQTINIDDIKLELREVTNITGSLFETFIELDGLRSKNIIKEGSVLVEEALEKKPIVSNGDWITAITVSGNVIIEVNAEVKQEGIEGEIIKIVTRDRKQFKAKIIDSHNAIIVE